MTDTSGLIREGTWWPMAYEGASSEHRGKRFVFVHKVGLWWWNPIVGSVHESQIAFHATSRGSVQAFDSLLGVVTDQPALLDQAAAVTALRLLP